MIEFENADKLEEYIANRVAEFVRDNMPKLEDAPFDYEDHYNYIFLVYMDWAKHLDDDL